MNQEQAHDIVLEILNNHDVSIVRERDIDLIVNGLEIAGDKEFFLTWGIRTENIKYENRTRRVKTLEKIIEQYDLFKREECFKNSVQSKSGNYPNILHWYLREYADEDLDRIIESIKKLHKTEVFLQQLYPFEKIPNSRPQSAKNAGAKCICSTLVENQISIWKSCDIIADMLIMAGIENKEQDKVKRALYDKLRRANLDTW
ncbi:MAG: hypothetical protein IIA77_04955 [Proteobacteria bacterium]|nr:hypothetical protein [Pseudomonadota bacterium]